MSGKFSKLFHKQTDNDFKIGEISLDRKFWPEEWTKIEYKSYPRMPCIILPKVDFPKKNMGEILRARESGRDFDKKKYLTMEELSAILFGVGINSESKEQKRFYPSGGARYPLEIYLAIKRVEGMSEGIYHYNVLEHSLESLLIGGKYINDFKDALFSDWSKEVAAGIILTAAWERNFVKYGDFGYRLILLEAGHCVQNINLIGAALGIKSCNLGGFSNPRINKLLDIENEGEDSLYVTVLGK